VKWLIKLINKQIGVYFEIYLASAERQKEIERIRIMDFCTAYIALLNSRIMILEDELRRNEAIPSTTIIEERTKSYYHDNFDSIMRFYDLNRQTAADRVVDYRKRNSPPLH